MSARAAGLAVAAVLLLGGPAAAQDGTFHLAADSMRAALSGRAPVEMSGAAWRYRVGDDPAFARPGYDDRRWPTLVPWDPRPEALRSAVRQARRNERAGGNAVGWLRLHVHADPSLVGRPVALWYFANGASEVYFDGERVYRVGEVDRRPGARAAVRNVSLPRQVQLGRQDAVVAVRYNLASAATVVGRLNGWYLFATGLSPTAAIEGHADLVLVKAGVTMALAGLLAGLALLHLLLFAFRRRRRDHLYLATSAGLGAVYFAGTSSVLPVVVGELHGLLILARFGFVAAALGVTALVAFLHTTFGGRLRRTLWIVAAASAVQCVQTVFLPGSRAFANFAGALYLVGVVEAIRIVALAVWRGMDGARIIGAGVLCASVFIAYRALIPFLGLPLSADTFLMLGVAAIPIAASIHLAREYTRANRRLQHLSHELERKVEERTAALSASESKFRGVVENANDAILLLRADTVEIRDANPAAERLLGRSVDALRGLRFSDLCPPGRYEHYRALFVAYLRTREPIHEDLHLVRADGERVPVEISASVTSVDGERMVQAIVHDLTERKRAEAAQEEARLAAESANETKSRFLANMSHELRTPLNAILGYSEMLQEEAEDAGRPELVPDLARIHTAGRHLLGLINDVLDLSKIEAGRMELHLEEFEVAALAREVADTVRPLVEHQANALEVELDPRLDGMRGDAVKLRQILLNLLSNAAKFTDHGRVTLRVEPLRDADGGEWTGFEVRDTGTGMSAAQLDRLFQPFVQVDEDAARKRRGTGLGLAISRRYAEMMGGSLGVSSVLGEGTRFVLRLPTSGAALPLDAATLREARHQYQGTSGAEGLGA